MSVETVRRYELKAIQLKREEQRVSGLIREIDGGLRRERATLKVFTSEFRAIREKLLSVTTSTPRDLRRVRILTERLITHGHASRESATRVASLEGKRGSVVKRLEETRHCAEKIGLKISRDAIRHRQLRESEELEMVAESSIAHQVNKSAYEEFSSTVAPVEQEPSPQWNRSATCQNRGSDEDTSPPPTTNIPTQSTNEEPPPSQSLEVSYRTEVGSRVDIEVIKSGQEGVAVTVRAHRPYGRYELAAERKLFEQALKDRGIPVHELRVIAVRTGKEREKDGR